MSVCFAQTSTLKGLHHFLHAVADSTGAESPSVHFSGESEAHSEDRQIPGTHIAPLQRLRPSDSPRQAVLATECFISPNGWATPASPRLSPLNVGEGERRPPGDVHLIHVPPKPLLARVSRAECHSWTLWLCCPRWDSSSILQWQSTPPRLVAANSQHFLWSTCPITCRSGSSCSLSKAVAMAASRVLRGQSLCGPRQIRQWSGPVLLVFGFKLGPLLFSLERARCVHALEESVVV